MLSHAALMITGIVVGTTVGITVGTTVGTTVGIRGEGDAYCDRHRLLLRRKQMIVMTDAVPYTIHDHKLMY